MERVLFKTDDPLPIFDDIYAKIGEVKEEATVEIHRVESLSVNTNQQIEQL
jgi:hypothetical protein